MNIKRIKVNNFKTYLSLDLALKVTPEKPLILIGGANGGGKTTLYEAIKGALYGREFRDEKNFIDQINVGAPEKAKARIFFEVHFEGYLGSKLKEFILSRTYSLNEENRAQKVIAESVCLRFESSEYKYGTFTPQNEKERNRAIIDKVINANLPYDLSHYFLFDAMEAKKLLEESQLSYVIRDNIEKVMGFRKYVLLSKAAQELYQKSVAQKQKDQEQRYKYEDLIKTLKTQENELAQEEKKQNEAEKSLAMLQEDYQRAKYAQQGSEELKAQIHSLEQEIKSLKNQEKELIDSFSQNITKIDENIGFPLLQEGLSDRIEELLKQKEELDKLPIRDIAFVRKLLLEAVKELQEKHDLPSLEPERFIETILAHHLPEPLANVASERALLFENVELKQLENLRQQKYVNIFPQLLERKKEWEAQKGRLPELEQRLKNLQESASESNYYNIISDYERKDAIKREWQEAVNRRKREIESTKNKLKAYEISDHQSDDKEFRALEKLKTFFDEVFETLLEKRKAQIEENMARYLNESLYAYQNNIGKVELSTLPNLNFKIYHKQGNEISLEQLNTASKQIVIQVLLKVLHEYGDYSPPILIDTVMGALDVASKNIMLESFFPSLSHQTILLSSNSEINPEKDYPKIKDYVAQSFTLVRDRTKQCTSVVEGYFENSEGYLES